MTVVTVYSESLGIMRQLGVSHAERLLRMPASGWVLKDKDYTFSKRHGIRRRKHKGENQPE